MVTKYVFGNPFETNAVTATFKNDGNIYLSDIEIIKKDFCEGGKVSSLFPKTKLDLSSGFELSIPLLPDDMIFGLGEAMGAMNKRGRIYEMWCSDDPLHTEDKKSLYGAHPFFIIYSPERKTCAGFFVDYPGKIEIDAAFTDANLLKIKVERIDLNLYFIPGDSLISVSEEFRKIIGKSYVPPFWAYGYMQSRWGYGSEDDLRNVYDEHVKRNIPLDAIFLDIDYMKDFRDFTYDENKFKDFKGIVGELKEKNIHVVPIIDAGIKADEKGDDVCASGLEKDYFCRKANGSLFKASVWPGLSVFTDFLNPEAREWFGKLYGRFTDAGIDGFWNDMNEPALFFSEDGLISLKKQITETFSADLENFSSLWQVKESVLSVQNNMEDYKSFYHKVPLGIAGGLSNENCNPHIKTPAKELSEYDPSEEFQKFTMVRHDFVHNLYGMNMTRAASEFFEKEVKDRKILLFSRASYIGSHRYGGIWTGDNASWWAHILLCIRQLPALNMCGFLYSGCDTGGFGGNVNREMLLRFISLSVFTPLFRNHSAAGTRNQEVYRFEETEDFRGLISFRYRLIPYLSSQYEKCAEEGKLLFRPLGFDYQDDEVALRIDDQLMYGEDLMIAPVYTENARGRTVYLPENMTMVRCTKEAGLISGKPEMTSLKKGAHYVSVEPNEIVFFIKEGHHIKVSESAQNTALLDMENLETW